MIEEVPIAFWSWQRTTPTIEEVEAARQAVETATLFLRAGQLDYEQNEARRIRPVEGRLPPNIRVHLVYNATEEFLARFANINLSNFATLIAATYQTDAARGARDGCSIVGLQLDIDVPTSKLERYAELLRFVRRQLPPHAQLSITGLQTWMHASALKQVLAQTDFWIPQFYGDIIPASLTAAQAISSPSFVRRGVAQARKLNHPFYAGLAAYSHALLYSSGGKLIALRGDISPSEIAGHTRLRLIARQPLHDAEESAPQSISEWRYVFQADTAINLNGWSIRQGEHIVLSVPSSAGLRLAMRVVREQGGTSLLGICIFRLPNTGEDTTLTLDEIAAARNERESQIETKVQAFEVAATKKSSHDLVTNAQASPPLHIVLTAENQGTASARLGDDAFVMTAHVPRGSIVGIQSLDDFTSIETLCYATATHHYTTATEKRILRPCGPGRADAIRVSTPAWRAGERAGLVLALRERIQQVIPIQLSQQAVDGRQWQTSYRLEISTLR